MDRFNNRKYPDGLADGCADVSVLQPLAHAQDGHLGETLHCVRHIMICQLNDVTRKARGYNCMPWLQYCLLALFALPLMGQLTAQTDAADWPMYNRDLAGTRFSPLRQIDVSNVGTLKQAWSYNLGKAIGNEAGSEFTPIVVKGVLYLAAFHYVTALDPESGQEIWRYELKEGTPSKRGIAYWPGDSGNPPRVIFTTGSKMV